MGWIAKIFGAASKEEMDGLHLETKNGFWAIKPTGDLTKILKALHIVITSESIIYLEGGSPDGRLELFLDNKKIHSVEKIALGTIWPKPLIYHIRATNENIGQLIDISEEISPVELAVHFHIYEPEHVILEWYDAFTDEILLSKALEENKVKSFCLAINSTYEYRENTEYQ